MVPIWPSLMRAPGAQAPFDDHVAQLIEHLAVQRAADNARHVLKAVARRQRLRRRSFQSRLGSPSRLGRPCGAWGSKFNSSMLHAAYSYARLEASGKGRRRAGMSVAESNLPTIAVAMGDPAGISPELLARLLAEPDIRPLARFVIFGDARVLEMGAKVAGTNPDVARAKSESALPADREPADPRRSRQLRSRRRDHRQGDARGRQFRHREFPPRASLRRERRSGCGLLHALQQGGDALCLSGLRRRDPLRARRHRLRTRRRANSISSAACGMRA